MSRSCWARNVKGVSIAVVFPSYAVHRFGAAIWVSVHVGEGVGASGYVGKGGEGCKISLQTFITSHGGLEMSNCTTGLVCKVNAIYHIKESPGGFLFVLLSSGDLMAPNGRNQLGFLLQEGTQSSLTLWTSRGLIDAT